MTARARPKISTEERRARLAIRHHLATASRVDDPSVVAGDLVGLHGTDPASVYLTLRARLVDPSPAVIERAMYEDRSLVRLLGMRRTMFVEPVELAAIVQAACTRTIAIQQRKLLMRLLEAARIPEPERWIEEVEAATVAELEARGEALANELTAADPRLATKVSLAEGKSYAAEVSIVTRVLLLLAADGRIVRTRPRGSWISGQYRWAPLDRWIAGGLRDWTTRDAQAELARRWLASFGPAPLGDLRWWTGWTMGDTRKAVTAVGAEEVEIEDGGTGVVLPGDLESTSDPGSWIALLPALDPTVMGWAERGWYLGAHRQRLFDTNGNAGPTIWADGRVVGGWGQHGSGAVVVRLLEDVGRETAARIDEEADRLERWIGAVRVTPRFRTPLEKEIAAAASPSEARGTTAPV